ncbi:hypothetical protein N7U49_28960 [Streptomyces sp. AD2-2]|nr:hypothetical protein N7U49_28960 [Streptomyces sp. AD2-2]
MARTVLSAVHWHRPHARLDPRVRVGVPMLGRAGEVALPPDPHLRQRP